MTFCGFSLFQPYSMISFFKQRPLKIFNVGTVFILKIPHEGSFHSQKFSYNQIIMYEKSNKNNFKKSLYLRTNSSS